MPRRSILAMRLLINPSRRHHDSILYAPIDQIDRVEVDDNFHTVVTLADGNTYGVEIDAYSVACKMGDVQEVRVAA